jgi:hypothetical protein
VASGEASGDIGPVRRCALYSPGHTVHFIQARHGWEERRPKVPGRLVAVDGNLIVVRMAGRERRYRNHEPERLRSAAERAGGEVILQAGLALLTVPHEGGGYVFSIADADEPWRACLVEEDDPGPLTTAEIARRILDRGGGYFRPA